MILILPKGFARHPMRSFCGSQQRWTYGRTIILGLAMCLLLSSAFARTAPASAQAQEKKQPPAPATATPQPAQPAEPPVPAPAAAPELPPPQPPVISWDGKLLTIDAENSSLEQVLMEIRTLTHATMDIPSSAGSEPVALHIGPAPIRDVLSTLLYGSSFDYVMQSPDDDPDGLRTLILTARGQADDSADPPMVAGSAASAVKPPGARMMKGWSAPGKTAAQASAEAVLAAQKAAEESAAAADPTTSENSDPAAADSASPAESSQSRAANNADSHSPNSVAATSSETTTGITVTDIPANSTADAASSSGSSAEEKPEVSQRMQDMMHMFEQRRQIQAQQNQPPSPPPASN